MTSNRTTPGIDASVQGAGKREWAKPEIATFEAVAVTKGVVFRPGDGVNNLS